MASLSELPNLKRPSPNLRQLSPSYVVFLPDVNVELQHWLLNHGFQVALYKHFTFSISLYFSWIGGVSI